MCVEYRRKQHIVRIPFCDSVEIFTAVFKKNNKTLLLSDKNCIFFFLIIYFFIKLYIQWFVL